MEGKIDFSLFTLHFSLFTFTFIQEQMVRNIQVGCKPMSNKVTGSCPARTVPNILRQQCSVSCSVCSPFIQNTLFRNLLDLLPVSSTFRCPLSHRSQARYHFAPRPVITLLWGSCLPVGTRGRGKFCLQIHLSTQYWGLFYVSMDKKP